MNRDYKLCEKYCRNWTIFCKVWNRECTSKTKLPTDVGTKLFPQDWQGHEDNNNLGICTFAVSHRHPNIQWVNHLLLFIARLSLFMSFHIYFLSVLDLFNIDPEVEGAVIAGEIIDCSSLSTECIKCDGACTITGEKSITCHGACNPHQHFQVCCLPQSQHDKTNYICQICNPSGREDIC